MIKLIIFYLHVAIAYHCQEQYKIPVSIQIAQSMAESGLGYSHIAQKSNNCFGIVAFCNWNGDVYHINNKLGYRKYETITDSYHDHAKFLAYHYSNMVGRPYEYWIANCKGYGKHQGYWKFIELLIKENKLDRYDKFTDNTKR